MNDSGETPLTKACIQGVTSVVAALIKNGADVDMKGLGNWAPIMGAAMQGHLDIVKMLVDHGADVTAKNKIGQTALELAKYSNKVNVVHFIESHIENQKLESVVIDNDFGFSSVVF